MIDPFAYTYDDYAEGDSFDSNLCLDPKSEAYGEDSRSVLSLFELNEQVRQLLNSQMRHSYWVAAEISELRVAANGHCYLELVQKHEASGSLVAKARATIWRQSYRMIASHFEHVTNQRLCAGIKVMAMVTVSFHELYGYSLNVEDIDPTYTLGDLAKRRQEILEQLTADGVIDMNSLLPLPRVISRVAVVSSATAAGFGDFCNQLEQSGYHFRLQLFAATMQGDGVERSVIEALDRIAAEWQNWDVVVIIRGGGAATDLNGFDSYLLAANVAQFPLPVLTGIGHERDETVIDYVAHTRLKTPTAVAAFLIDSRKREGDELQSLQERLARALQQRITEERTRFTSLHHRFALASSQYVGMQRDQLLRLASRLELLTQSRLQMEHAGVLRLASRLELLAQSNLQLERQQLDIYPQRLRQAVERLFFEAHQQHQLLERSLKLAGPERILSLGFSITLKDGKAVRHADQLQPGDEIETRLQTGSVRSVVKDKQ